LALCRPDLTSIDGRGWMEVFAIHSRNLNEFFSQEDHGGKYMRPDHFVAWTYSYKFDKGLFRRASGQVAHLTYDRENPEEKTQWAFEDIFKALREQCIVFLGAVVLVETLMAYHANRRRAEALLAKLPRIRFANNKK